MATGVITTTSIDNMSETFIAKHLEVREHTGVMDKVTDVKRLPLGYGVTYHEPYVGALDAGLVTDGVEYDSPSLFTDTDVTVTSSLYAVQTMITYRSNDRVHEDLFGIAGRLMTNSLEYKRDVLGLAELDSAASSTGSGTATLTWGHLTAASAVIRSGLGGSGATLRTGARTTGDPPDSQLYAIIHEYQWRALAAQVGGLFAVASDATIGTTAPNSSFTAHVGGVSDWQARWLTEHFRTTTIDGVKVLVDNNMAGGGSSTKSGVIARDSTIALKFRTVRRKEFETADGLAKKLTLADEIGFGERADHWKVELNVACATPTT